MCKITKSALTG